ncbi:MAG: hypothetical protein INR69_02850 [Mucilaginibacter polytrichastri]|nr:hypothetical protein [Mucilaginibacter polytrichastri]
MAKITEQDVVSFLREKVTSLKEELRKAEEGLAYFSSQSFAVPAKRGRKPKSLLDDVTESVSKILETGSKKRARKKGTKSKAPVNPKTVEVPQEFDPKLTRDKKIVYALSQLGSGFSEDVSELLHSLEPDEDRAKMERLVTQRLSALKIAGSVKEKRKSGRKTEYML